MNDLSHFDRDGNARMVDVSKKESSRRKAVARGCILLGEKASLAIDNANVPKGDVFSTARVGAISAVKRTWETIPLCHLVAVGSIDVEFLKSGCKIEVTCRVEGVDTTGFEMEALNGVVTALLILYDMTKSLDRGMEIVGVRLMSKSGGKSGDYQWQQ